MNTKSYLLLPVLIASLFGLSACGQKGPLYLPQSEQQAVNEAAAADDTEQGSGSEDETEEAAEEVQE